ncbi:MAG: sulfatase-like hydrolase/transferase [Saprospiraceae bacterium]|nr:sulfatase-like hydrolase/transferase [Saprospiraceae bacterium]MCB9319724.1 sulfatase-like hydrolase/transferase [Lewinellaceae bacterium]
MNFMRFLSQVCLTIFALPVMAQQMPNIVLIFPDNLGIGEVASYGGVRNVPTPNIDRIGSEGIRLTNFNVEYSCVPSRAAIITGRYATRTGENYFNGLTLWEQTLPEALKSVGYATGLFGKYDMGGASWLGKKEPTQQGFDRWYGIPGTSHLSQFTSMEGFDPERNEVPYVWEGVSGSTSKKVKPFDLDARRTLDREAALKAIDFIKEQTSLHTPFFVYYPMTQLHLPALPNPDMAGKTGAGDVGDAMADVDYNTGLILDALHQLGLDDNTLVIWCTDNGAEMRRPWRGSPGPWRGYYNSAMEGGIRTPCLIRWPEHIPSGQVSNQIVHQIDLYATIAAATGHPEIIPGDRIMDSKNQLPFLEGKQLASNRDAVLYMNGSGQLMAVKWHDWKLWYYFQTEMPDPEPDNLVRLFDLRVDPQEENDVKDYYPWVIGIVDSIVQDYEKSLIQEPRVPATATDPYLPPKPGSGKPVSVYTRTDRQPLPVRGEALPNPDFSGSWSTTPVDSRSPLGRPYQPPIPDLGSGWGDKISVLQKENQLEIERVVFLPREIQPLVKYRYALDGSRSENNVNMGRTLPAIVSHGSWINNRLVIASEYPCQELKNEKWTTATVVQTLWLQPASGTPWEPQLVIETERKGVFGGETITTRTLYNRGYR